VAELRASSGLSGEIYVQGYYGKDTDGGGHVYLDETDTTSTDDGLSVFVDSDGGRWKRNFNGFVTPEMAGAKGGLAAGDLAALQAADDYANTNGLELVGSGNYLLEGALVLKTNTVRFLAKGFKIADNFPSAEAILLDDTASTSVDHEIRIDGNRDNQTADVIAYHANSAGFLHNVKLHIKEAKRALQVSGNTERSNFVLFSENCDTCIREAELGTGDVTPDECTYYLADIGSQRYFSSSTASSCALYLNTENSDAATPFAHLVDVKKTEGKTLTISGLMRTPRSKVIGAGPDRDWETQ